ncbi:MAG: hypothetical protein ACE5GX_02520 [Thermoanaerobaculia bacterium]
MNVSTLRVVLALIIVGGFVGMVSLLLVAATVMELTPEQRAFVLNLMEEISKVMAGFIGLIIGYYFSRPQASAGSEEGETGPPSQGCRVRRVGHRLDRVLVQPAAALLRTWSSTASSEPSGPG